MLYLRNIPLDDRKTLETLRITCIEDMLKDGFTVEEAYQIYLIKYFYERNMMNFPEYIDNQERIEFFVTVGIDKFDDFHSFTRDMIAFYGDFYDVQAEMFFERATCMAQLNLPGNAISDLKFALTISQYSANKEMPVYMYGLLAQLYMDTGKIRKAKHYCQLGSSLAEDPDDLEMFERLREDIRGEEWKDGG